MTVEAVEASETAEADEFNETDEVYKVWKITTKYFSHPDSWIQLYFDVLKKIALVESKYQVEF